MDADRLKVIREFGPKFNADIALVQLTDHTLTKVQTVTLTPQQLYDLIESEVFDHWDLLMLLIQLSIAEKCFGVVNVHVRKVNGKRRGFIEPTLNASKRQKLLYKYLLDRVDTVYADYMEKAEKGKLVWRKQSL